MVSSGSVIRLSGLVILCYQLLILKLVAGDDLNNLDTECSGNEDLSKSRDFTVNDIYDLLKEKMKSIRKDCGEICETREEKTKVVGKKYYDVIEKQFDCKKLFANKDVDATSFKLAMPPRQIPKFLKANFTYQGRVPAEQVWMNDMDGQTHSLTWTEEEIESRRAGFRAGARSGLYGKEVYEDIMKHLDTEMVVEGQHVLVIGSQKPWIEALLLEYGAKHVTTVDYVEIKSTHPQVTTITPQQMSEKYLDGTLTSFDSIVTFSSLEHSGLGRYGDDLNPFGDLIAMAKAWCVIKDGGKALVGVPSGPDKILFNACRIYGPLQYSHLFANWKQVYTETDFRRYSRDCDWCYQSIHIIQK